MPEQALAHVSMHTSLHSFLCSPGLRLHADVDWLVRFRSMDWAKYLREIEAMRIKTRAFVSLAMAYSLLGTPIPPWVLRRLYPGRPKWKAISEVVRTRLPDIAAPWAPGRLRTVLLDCLIDDRGPARWTASVAFPSDDWLRDFLGDTALGDSPSVWRMHMARYRMLAQELSSLRRP